MIILCCSGLNLSFISDILKMIFFFFFTLILLLLQNESSVIFISVITNLSNVKGDS